MHPPRIGFNIFPYRDARSGGMLYYALNMLRQFASKVPDRLTLFCGSHSRKLVQGIDSLDDVSIQEIVEPNDIFEHRSEFDVLFTPASWGGLAMLDYPTIHVLPDIQEQYYPEFFSANDLRNRYIFHPWVSRSSTLLVTISNFSKQTIVEKFGVPEKKVRVTHLAAHPIFSDPFEHGIRPSNMPDEKQFLFYPSNAWNHKNHRGLLDALVELGERHGFRVPVIFSGHLLEGEFNRFDIPNEIKARGLEDQVFHIGRTDLQGLKYLYLNAAALIHPSLFEGFGIPLVEAMSSGCPIIAAKATSIPEICGESALYFDPHNHVDIAEEIKQFFEKPTDVAARRRLGKEMGRQYSDARTADETLQIIEEAYWLAGEKALEKRIRSSTTNLRSPTLSVFISAKALRSDGACAEPVRLRSEMPDLVQLICVSANEGRKRHESCRHSGCVFIESSQDMRSALKEAAEVARGRYFFFAENASVPLRSFVYYLADAELDGTMGAMLHGDSYLKDRSTGHIRERIVVGEDDIDALRTACCSSLSFVVLSDAFRRLLNESDEDWSSFQQMAHSLWSSCRRQRIYRVVNCVTIPSAELDWLWEKLRSQFPPGSFVNALLETRIGRRLSILMLRAYRLLPSSAREIVYDRWRIARRS